jgi:hypothetical protein
MAEKGFVLPRVRGSKKVAVAWQLSLPECFCRGVWPVSVCFGWYAKGFVLNFYCSGELKRVLVNDLPDRHETNVQAGNNEVKLFEN